MSPLSLLCAALIVYTVSAESQDGTIDFNDDSSQAVGAFDKVKRARNPYSWMLTEQGKRARNPYSWMAQKNKRSLRFTDDIYRQPRNPYSWMYTMFDKRARNPYSWMNE